MNSIQAIPIVKDYFGEELAPIVAEEFIPGRGWVRQNCRKRISRVWARKLRAQGVTSVALTNGQRTADFRIEELTRYDRRPLFPGQLIGSGRI